MSTNSIEQVPLAPEDRIARFDEFFDPKSRSTVYRKTNKEKLSKHAQRLEQKKPVLVVRRILDNRGRHTETCVDIRSRELCDVLIDIFEDAEGLELARSTPTCNPKLLYHAFQHFHDYLQKEKMKDDPSHLLINDLEVAIHFVLVEHARTFADIRELGAAASGPCITFDTLWAIFPPSMLVYTRHVQTEQDMVLRTRVFDIERTQEGVFAIVMSYCVSNDGNSFGLAGRVHRIPAFEGTMRIQDLPIFPLHYHDRQGGIRRHAIERGKRFANLGEKYYGETSGPGMVDWVGMDGTARIRKMRTQGRVMIDPEAFRVFQPESEINSYVQTPLKKLELTEEHYLICTPVVLGFGFGMKAWGGFAIDRLKPAIFSDEPFRSLVLSDSHKQLIHALVKQHELRASKFDDFIQGKGKGLVGLLAGPPGCGKTLTAEAVAEVTERPLYCVSAGELGTDADNVDKCLEQILELAQRWKAIVLLDEADVFLSQRKDTDIERNALVAIFLRQLEYYQGILILTTNLVAQCDIAFESRIHFTVHYPNLELESRRQIWEVFLRKATGVPSHPFSQKDIQSLSSVPLNGRQIKNVIATAQSLCLDDDEPLSIRHIRTVLDVMRDWQKARADKNMFASSTSSSSIHTPDQLHLLKSRNSSIGDLVTSPVFALNLVTVAICAVGPLLYYLKKGY